VFVLAAPPPPPPVVVGRSVQARPIAARRIGDPDAGTTALVIGSIHGDEGAGRAIVRALAAAAEAPAGLDVWLVASVNPDGVARRSRTNAHGVDLNRNFPRGWRASARGGGDYGGPRPLSEPETRAVRELILRIRPQVTIWFHQPWGQVLAPCRGPAALQRRYATVAGLALKRCRGSDLPGTATRWQSQALPRSTPFVVELPSGGLSTGAVTRHVRAVRAVLAAARR
jgi:protein MpaA